MLKKLCSLFVLGSLTLSGLALAQEFNTAEVQRSTLGSSTRYDGHIEAINNTMMAAQVAGVVKNIYVQAGATVKAGDKLLEIEASQALQQQQAAQAQVDATRAQLNALTNELQRQRELHKQNYLSQGAIERTEAQYKATQAQLKAQQAQVAAARTQTGFFIIRAPYNGIVIDVPANPGDMAMPGTPLLSLFDPNALRVTTSVPATSVPTALHKDQVRIFLGEEALNIASVQPLPTADPFTHSVRVRIQLDADNPPLFPGQQVKVHVPNAIVANRLFIPLEAVVRRAELTGVYVLSQQQRPILRQVRLGTITGDTVEVLSGLSEGEHVILDQYAASKE
ncbi:MAG TPA: efflux RND transporter periplasmic adaptor subunit [Alcanivoracaceae bacterium]|nr:efflux RND transporter periplasmic adaptor subunit [Alcanivoracaceae bacterium]